MPRCQPTLWSRLTNRFGPPPAPATPNSARDEWTTRCLTEGFWENGVPKLSVLWMSEPDLTQHSRGVGVKPAMEGIRGLDRALALLLRELDRRGVRAKTDVVVLSDHGFSTIIKTIDTAAVLRRAGLNARRQFQNPPIDGDVMVVANAGAVLIYVIGSKPGEVQRAVKVLQHENFTGTLFTRDGLPGTFPLSEARLLTRRAHRTLSCRCAGSPANTPTACRPDLRRRVREQRRNAARTPRSVRRTWTTPCVASGPDFRAGMTNTVATGSLDIAPTLLWVFGITPPKPTDEAFCSKRSAKGEAKPPQIEQRKLEARATSLKVSGQNTSPSPKSTGCAISKKATGNSLPTGLDSTRASSQSVGQTHRRYLRDEICKQVLAAPVQGDTEHGVVNVRTGFGIRKDSAGSPHFCFTS